MKRLLDPLARHGFGFMMAGFFLAVASLIVFMRIRFGSQLIRSVVMGFFVLGIAIYIAGRIGSALGTRAKRASSSPPDGTDSADL